jgi:hypothetical protein
MVGSWRSYLGNKDWEGLYNGLNLLDKFQPALNKKWVWQSC